MKANIPPWKRAFQRLLMTRLVTALVRPVLHHADAFLLRLTDGRLGFSGAAGLPILELTTTGAKSGKLRTLPLAGYPDEDRYVLIASNFGGAHHPAWYHNLKANPECRVRKNGNTGIYVAREAEGEERQRYWKLAVSYYSGYPVYQQRTPRRKIPVMVLEPKG